MSKDVQLTFPCPHTILEEEVILGDDRRELPTNKPVSSGSSTRVMVNNQFYVPPQGLFSPAKLRNFSSGPYQILSLGEDLILKTKTTTTTVILPLGSRVPTDKVVELVNLSNSPIRAFNEKGHLFLVDTSSAGPDSRIVVTGGAASSLGFQQQGARGVEAYPGWDLYTPEDLLTSRYPRFRKPIKGNPVLKVSYQTFPQTCLRCGGTYLEHDVRFNSGGDALYVEGENLLYQAALKILFTDLGSNPFHSWYGTTIRQRIGTKNVGAIVTLLSESVRNSLNRLQGIQTEQGNYQIITPEETLYSLLSVDVTPHELDPRAYYVDVVIQNASTKPIEVSIFFSVPLVLPLISQTTIQR